MIVSEKLVLYSCLQDEIIRKFKVGAIIPQDWITLNFLGRIHHVKKSLWQPCLREMIKLKIIKPDETYGKKMFKIQKPIMDLENTSKIYRNLNFF